MGLCRVELTPEISDVSASENRGGKRTWNRNWSLLETVLRFSFTCVWAKNRDSPEVHNELTKQLSCLFRFFLFHFTLSGRLSLFWILFALNVCVSAFSRANTSPCRIARQLTSAPASILARSLLFFEQGRALLGAAVLLSSLIAIFETAKLLDLVQRSSATSEPSSGQRTHQDFRSGGIFPCRLNTAKREFCWR